MFLPTFLPILLIVNIFAINPEGRLTRAVQRGDLEVEERSPLSTPTFIYIRTYNVIPVCFGRTWCVR